jgi:hypothetical protein
MWNSPPAILEQARAFAPHPPASILFLLQLLAALPGFLAAEFPDDTFPAVFAVEAGVGAGPAGIQAFLAIPELHLLALYAGFPFWVKSTLH